MDLTYRSLRVKAEAIHNCEAVFTDKLKRYRRATEIELRLRSFGAD